MFNNKKINGFSLIELILVLGLSSFVFINFIQSEKKKTEQFNAENAGLHISEIGNAFDNYLKNESNHLAINYLKNENIRSIPLEVLVGKNIYDPNFQLKGMQLLPDNTTFKSPLDNNYKAFIRKHNNSIHGLVIYLEPIQDNNGNTKLDWLGIAIKKAGNYSGGIFSDMNKIEGNNSLWTFSKNDTHSFWSAKDFPKNNGLLAYRTNYYPLSINNPLNNTLPNMQITNQSVTNTQNQPTNDQNVHINLNFSQEDINQLNKEINKIIPLITN